MMRGCDRHLPGQRRAQLMQSVLRFVPGRKTDIKDSEWICDLVAHGLVRASFVPPPEIRRLRDFTRLRKAQINEPARVIQRLEKVLQEAGIKLTSVASGPYSKSARAMLEALLCGISAPEQLAELAKARMRQRSLSCARRWPTGFK
jgi:transposase